MPLSFPLSRSLSFPLSRSLCKTAGIDPAALAYITAVQTAKGSAVTGVQKNAINAFVVAEKAAGRWSLHKGLFLPIWNLAAANAINLVTLGTGTYSAGTTPGTGFVTANGTNGYFDTGLTPSGVGMTNDSFALTVLLKSVSGGTVESSYMGNYSGGSSDFRLYATTYAVYVEGMTNTSSVSATIDRSIANGILIGSRNSGSSAIYQRKTSGVQTLVSSVTSAVGSPPATNIFAMAYNAYGATGYSSGDFGFFGIHLGLSAANASAFSLNLKTLWETCTGLVLP